MTKKEVKVLILKECLRQAVEKAEQVQYVLATVEHETNGTFKPVKEAYWLSEKWRKRNLYYYPYYGRGFVQITHKENYAKFSKLLGVDLVKKPNLALDFENSIFILVYGMKHGTFTGLKLDDFFSANGSNFYDARRIINGMDKAKKIALLAQKTKVSYA